MKQRLLAWCGGVLALLGSPILAMAEDEPVYYAKLEGYSKSVKLEGGSVTLTWFLLVLLAGICVAVLFKDAKRTHLD